MLVKYFRGVPNTKDEQILFGEMLLNHRMNLLGHIIIPKFHDELLALWDGHDAVLVFVPPFFGLLVVLLIYSSFSEHLRNQIGCLSHTSVRLVERQENAFDYLK